MPIDWNFNTSSTRYDIPYSGSISQFDDEKTDIFCAKLGSNIFWSKNTFILSRFSVVI